MRRLAIVCLLLSACGFERGGLDPSTASDGGDDDTDAARDVDGAVAELDAAIDAQPIDAPMIDAPPAAVCPGTYTGGYRYISAAAGWLAQERDCEDDQAGRTHLVVINDIVESGVVIGALSAIGAGNEVWVGVVRDSSSTTWRAVTGGNAPYLPWGTGQPDLGNQYVVRVDKFTGGFYDRGADDALPALCECDGRPPVNADWDPGTN